MKKRETKSPIKNLPVRMPGQSGKEQLDSLLDDQVLPWMLAAGMIVVMTIQEWVRAHFNTQPTPWLYTILSVCVVVGAVRKFRKVYVMSKAINLGRHGEEAVGQYLDEMLRPHGCHILHDIIGDHFNLDHVVIGPTGVFCVETKTHSKPVKGPCVVKYDGEKVSVNGFAPDRDPIVQAKAQASWLTELIEQSTGKRFPVKPLVVYPGWFVESTNSNPPVWVANEKAVINVIKNYRHYELPPEDVSLVTFHLKRYVISTGAKPVS